MLPATEKLSQPYKNELQAELLTKDKIMNLRSSLTSSKHLLIRNNKDNDNIRQRSKRSIKLDLFYRNTTKSNLNLDTISIVENYNSRIKREPAELSVFQHIMRDASVANEISEENIEQILHGRNKRDLENQLIGNQTMDSIVSTTPFSLSEISSLEVNNNGDLIFSSISIDNRVS